MTKTLNAEPRAAGKAESLRKKGLFPAVFYGKKEKATPIQINSIEFGKVWKEAGESTVVSIKMPTDSVDALIHDVQFDPVSNQPIHADFYVFEKGQKLEVSVPLEFVGESPAVKAGGVLVKVLHELQIKAEPANLPHEIEVDISGLLEINDNVMAKDVKLPSGVELLENPEEIVVAVNAQKEEKEEAPVDLSAIEVEKKGKKEEEGAEGEASGASGGSDK